MVQWDGMDRWDGCTSHGTLVQSHGIPLSHGTVGRDGQVGWLPQPWDIGTVPWDPLVPWYSGTGWTGGMAAPAMGHWYSPMGSPCPMVQWDGMDRWDGCTSHGTLVQSHGIPLSHGTVGRDGKVGWDCGTIPWDPLVSWYMGSPCPMVQWDGMDRWDGKVVQSHGIPCVPWDKWESQIPNGHSLATLDITRRGSQQLHVVRFLPPSTSFSLLDLLCVVCHCIVDRPVETPCRKMVCAHCISGLVLE